VQRLSLAVSTERLLPRLRRLRDGVRRRLGPSRSPEIREIEALSAAYLRDLSRLGLWLDAAVSEVEDGASRRPLVLALVSGRRLWGGVRVDPRGEGGVIQIALEPALRGRGHGRALLAHTVAVARARGLAFLDAEIARDNQASLALFRGAGFTLEAPAVAVHLRRRTPFDRYRLDLR
jgi:ribosomal protein S18 acetylase RimI-like enzyme